MYESGAGSNISTDTHMLKRLTWHSIMCYDASQILCKNIVRATVSAKKNRQKSIDWYDGKEKESNVCITEEFYFWTEMKIIWYNKGHPRACQTCQSTKRERERANENENARKFFFQHTKNANSKWECVQAMECYKVSPIPKGIFRLNLLSLAFLPHS